jgi:hypothetical protein
MKLILSNIDPDDWVLAIRAARYLRDRFQQDAWLAYGDEPNIKEFYAKRNKASITVKMAGALPQAQCDKP